MGCISEMKECHQFGICNSHLNQIFGLGIQPDLRHKHCRMYQLTNLIYKRIHRGLTSRLTPTVGRIHIGHMNLEQEELELLADPRL